MKTEEGIVLSEDGEMATIKAGRHAECENCGACPGSGASLLTVRNSVHARVGQRVLFEVQEEQSLKGAFLIFVFPLITLFAGAFLGGCLFEQLSLSVVIGRMIGAVLLFAGSAVMIKAFDKRKGRLGTLPSIVRILG